MCCRARRYQLSICRSLRRFSIRLFRLNLQSFLQFLQREWILFFIKPGARSVEQLRKRFSPNRAVELTAQRTNGSVHVAFGLKLAEDFFGELKIAFLQGFGSALQPRPGAFGIEKLDRLVAQRFIQSVAEIAGARETVPRLLGHSFMNHTADGLAYSGVHFGRP